MAAVEPYSGDHIASYYAATVNDSTRYPPFKGEARADVCVVGGGFSGIASALSLAERGYSVILLEARRVGWGASGRNGGQLIAGISGESRMQRQLGDDARKLLADIRYLGNDIVQRRIKDYGIDCDYQPGWMEVAARAKQLPALRAFYDERAKLGEGDHHSFVEGGDLPDLLGTDAYYGGYIDRRSGHLHPLNFVMGEARAATSQGVRIYEDSPVIAISGGARPQVKTADGVVHASSIVLAGNTYHPFARGPLAGLLFPTGSYIIATERLPNGRAAKLNPQNLAVADANVVLDYFRMTADGRILFGGRCNYSNRDPKDIAGTMLPRLIRIYPELAGTRVDFTWGGRIGIVLTRIPAIGRLEPNVYYMEGYCGHGVNTSHIAADIVADAIHGTTTRFDVFERVRQWRLPVGGWAGNQMLALGMLYYRMRDIL